MNEAIPAFLTIIIMPFTFSITNGIAIGLFSSFVFYFTTGQVFSDVVKLLSPPSSSPSGYEEISSVDIEDYVHVNDANKATALPKSNETTYNYYDYQPFVRIPSLFLTQSDSEELRKMSKRV